METLITVCSQNWLCSLTKICSTFSSHLLTDNCTLDLADCLLMYDKERKEIGFINCVKLDFQVRPVLKRCNQTIPIRKISNPASVIVECIPLDRSPGYGTSPNWLGTSKSLIFVRS